MGNEEKVIKYYLLCNKLKDVIRTGWKNWGVDRNRIESVAEHVYGVQMLALAMYSEYKYDVDISKVIMMLAIHELEETIIGDYTMFQITREEKERIGHEAVETILSNLVKGEELKSLIFEFDERKSKEARFAYFCDKLECDIQCKIYDSEVCMDLDAITPSSIDDDYLKMYLDSDKEWSYTWIRLDREIYHYDDNFDKVAEYVQNNDIMKLLKDVK